MTGADYWDWSRTSDLATIDLELEQLGDPSQWTPKPGDAKYLDLLFESGVLYHERRILTNSQADAKIALEMFKRLMGQPRHEQYPRADEALFLQALEFEFLGREPEMQKSFIRIVQLYPQSRWIPWVYLALADYFFAKSRYAEASRLYEKVTQFRKTEVYAYALAQLGSCSMQPLVSGEPRYGRALAHFYQAIESTVQGRGGPDELATRLRRQTRHELVRAYAYAGKASKAEAFFTKIGRGPNAEDETVAMMEALAQAYFEIGLLVESTYMYKQLISLHPKDANVCEWARQVYDNARVSAQPQVIVREGEAYRRIAREASCPSLGDDTM